MARGAPFTADWLGTSPLHLTAQYGNFDTCEVLLRAGCSRDARTKVDKTPLHIAAQEGHADICELLLMSGAEVDARDILLMTPLHWAVERGNVHSIEVLLKHCASVDAESKFDKTPPDIADDNGRPDLRQILQNVDNYRPVGIQSNSNSHLDSRSLQSLCQDVGLTVGQQEEVQSYSVKEGVTRITLDLDPVQMALSSAGEVIDSGGGHQNQDDPDDLMNSLPDLDPNSSVPNQEDAIRLLEAHGIRMLPEDELNISQTLSLTEAGKLVLSSLSSPHSSPSSPLPSSLSSPLPSSPDTSKLVLPSQRSGFISRPVTLGSARSVNLSQSSRPNLEVENRISLSSRPVQSPLNTLRSINLPNSKLLSTGSSKTGYLNTITTSRPGFLNKNTVTKVVTLSANTVKTEPKSISFINSPVTFNNKQPRVIKLTPEQFAALKESKSGRIVLAGTGNNGTKRENITLANQQRRKIPRVEELAELRRRLEIELREADRLRQEARKRDDTADRIRKQIEILSNI